MSGIELQDDDEKYSAVIAAPFANLGLICSADKLTRLDFLAKDTPLIKADSPQAKQVYQQLDAYLNAKTKSFDISLQLNGTEFQQRIWQQLTQIPYGERLTYSDLAAKLDTHPRVVGNACRNNPIPIIIPCHRIVAKQGLGGFAGEQHGFFIDVKKWLLAHEQV